MTAAVGLKPNSTGADLLGLFDGHRSISSAAHQLRIRIAEAPVVNGGPCNVFYDCLGFSMSAWYAGLISLKAGAFVDEASFAPKELAVIQAARADGGLTFAQALAHEGLQPGEPRELLRFPYAYYLSALIKGGLYPFAIAQS